MSEVIKNRYEFVNRSGERSWACDGRVPEA